MSPRRWEYSLCAAVRKYEDEEAFSGSWTWALRFTDKEYVGPAEIERYLDETGELGWELVSTMPLSGSGMVGTDVWLLFFKRPKG